MMNDRRISIQKTSALMSGSVLSVFLERKFCFNSAALLVGSFAMVAVTYFVLLLIENTELNKSSVFMYVTLILSVAILIKRLVSVYKFIEYTEFSNIGSITFLILFLLFSGKVFSVDKFTVNRFASIGFAAIVILLLCYTLSAPNTAEISRVEIMISGTSELLDAFKFAILNLISLLPICLYFSDNRKSSIVANEKFISSVTIQLIPSLFLFLTQTVLGRILVCCEYPAYQAGLCMDTSILQRVDSIIFSCTLLMSFVNIGATISVVSTLNSKLQLELNSSCLSFAAAAAAFFKIKANIPCYLVILIVAAALFADLSITRKREEL